MNRLQLVLWLEEQLRNEHHSGHLRNQVNRFVWSLLASTVASLTASGGNITWSTLWSLLPPALWVAAEETWPSIPWNTVTQYIAAAKQPPIVPPATAPAAPEAPPPAAHP